MKPEVARNPAAAVPSHTQRPSTEGLIVTHWPASGWLSSAVRGIIGRLNEMVITVSVGTSLAPALGNVRRMEGGGSVWKRLEAASARVPPLLVFAFLASVTV